MNQRWHAGITAAGLLIALGSWGTSTHGAPGEQHDFQQSFKETARRLQEWTPPGARELGRGSGRSKLIGTVNHASLTTQMSYADVCQFYAEKTGLKNANITPEFNNHSGGGNSSSTYSQFGSEDVRETVLFTRQKNETFSIVLTNRKGERDTHILLQWVIDPPARPGLNP